MLDFLQSAEQKASRSKQLKTAEAIVSLSNSPGWAAFVGEAERLIASFTPDVSSFDDKHATVIASQMAFISGIKRCIGLMDQQKSIHASLKGPESQ